MRSPLILALVLAVAAVGLGPLAAPADADSSEGFDAAKVDAFVNDYLDRHGLPGATVAVVRDGEIAHEAGYGEDSNGDRLTERSRLRIASVAKPFTAFTVLRLVQEGKIDLDAPVTRYLTDFDSSDDVTVRHLLAHTSGLPNPVIVGPADSLEERVDGAQGWQPTSEPGTSHTYSNVNYWVAARVVEEVSGQPFNDYLAERVFSPLGMSDTVNTTTTRDPVDGLADGHVTAYGMALPISEPEQMSSGAGGVVSTAHDMAAWLAMQQRGGVAPDGQRLLSQELVRESHTPQTNAQRTGLGWQVSGPGITPERISHSGNVGSFNAQHDLVPESGYGVVVLLNSFTPSQEHAYAISSGIIDLTEGEEPELGLPVAILTDLTLGALTVLGLALGVLGLRSSSRWATRRADWPTWRFALRLLPQLVAPALAVFLFLIAPALQDNSYTPTDVFGLFPALMVVLLGFTTVGLGLTVARVTARFRPAG